ncbi:metallophosphoesterase family protein [Candidatus Microgenomates bacterium]|nr:metallophosphoesterase family protein [Candidatus Microgenomates bacterium]
MKVLVIGDSHGNIENLKHAVGFGKEIEVGAIFHCGDWNNVLSIETVLSFGIPVYTVLGNADIDPVLIKELKEKNTGYSDEVLKVELGGKKILVSHYLGKLKQDKRDFDIGFYGHRHSQEKQEIDGKLFVRPGALENDINFCVYDTISERVEFITI